MVAQLVISIGTLEISHIKGRTGITEVTGVVLAVIDSMTQSILAAAAARGGDGRIQLEALNSNIRFYLSLFHIL